LVKSGAASENNTQGVEDVEQEDSSFIPPDNPNEVPYRLRDNIDDKRFELIVRLPPPSIRIAVNVLDETTCSIELTDTMTDEEASSLTTLLVLSSPSAVKTEFGAEIKRKTVITFSQPVQKPVRQQHKLFLVLFFPYQIFDFGAEIIVECK